MYDNGQGVKQDYFVAADWYKKACDGIVAKACFNLGVIYYKGQSVKRDYFVAADLSKKACDGGFAKGCGMLGIMYSEGQGVKQDYFAAADFFKKACDGGEAASCVGLGIMYANGKGVKQNIKKTLDLYGKSCDMKFEDGCEAYAKLKKIMTEKNKFIDVMPKSTDWNSTVTLTGKYYLKKFNNCCFFGKEKTENYHHLQLSSSINIIDNSDDIESLYNIKQVQIAYIDSASKKVDFLGIKNGDFITIRCENLWEGNTGHYALPVYCNNPTIIPSKK
jgi:TPR repeat protein